MKTNTLYIAGLDPSIDEATLQAEFEKHAVIERVTVIKDKVTRESKGFAYVMCASHKDATDAMKEMDGRIIADKPIKVKYSTSETPDWLNVLQDRGAGAIGASPNRGGPIRGRGAFPSRGSPRGNGLARGGFSRGGGFSMMGAGPPPRGAGMSGRGSPMRGGPPNLRGAAGMQHGFGERRFDSPRGPPPFLDSPDPRSMRRPGPPMGDLEPPSKVPRGGDSFRMIDDRHPPLRQSFGEQAPLRQPLDSYALGPRRDDRGSYMEAQRESFARDPYIDRTRESYEAPRDVYAPRDLYARSAAPVDRSLFNERSAAVSGVYSSPAYDRYAVSQVSRERDPYAAPRDPYAAPRDPYAAIASRSAEDTFSRTPQRDVFRNGRGSPPSARGGFEPGRRAFETTPSSYVDSARDSFAQEPKAGIRGAERWSGDPYSGY